jgi:hypothetical protein
MKYEWGRAPEAGRWQRAMPVWFMSLLVLALASGVGLWLFRQTFVWTPLQQVLSVGVRTQRRGQLAWHSDRPLSRPADGEPSRQPARHR